MGSTSRTDAFPALQSQKKDNIYQINGQLIV